MEIFLKIKPNLNPKLLQFMDVLTSMELCLKKKIYKERLWPLRASQVEFIISQAKCTGPWSLQESKTKTGIAQQTMAPAKTDTATFCCDCSRKVPVCAQQEFHCWTQNLLTMDLLLIAFPSFFIRIVLQVIVSCHLIGSLSNSKTQSSPRSHYILAVNAAQQGVVTWLFCLQGETFHYCRFCYIYLPRYKKLWYWYSPNFIGL